MKKSQFLLLAVQLSFAAYWAFRVGSDLKPSENKSSHTSVQEKRVKKSAKVNEEKQKPAQEHSQNASDVDVIVGKVEADYHKRIAAAYRIKQGKVSSSEETSLVHFLETPQRSDEGFALQNDVIEYLSRQTENKIFVSKSFIDILKDPTKNRVLREYMAQYIPDLVQNLRSSDTNEEELIHELVQVLWDLTNKREGALAGTALTSLHKIFKDDKIQLNKINDKAEKMLRDMDTGSASLSAAVQVLAISNQPAYANLIGDLLESDQHSVAFRMSLINAASKLASTEEAKTWLTKISQDSSANTHLRACADLNLKKLNSRN